MGKFNKKIKTQKENKKIREREKYLCYGSDYGLKVGEHKNRGLWKG